MPPYDIAIITDSVCDIPQELIDQYQIQVLPIHVHWGQDELLDRIDLSPQKFYERLVSDPVYPSTSQLTEKEYLDAFFQAKDDGAREIIFISLTGALSSTIENASKAASRLDIPVQVVDSGFVSMGEGFQALAAARMRNAGMKSEDILGELQKVRNRMVLFACLDTVSYVLKGGRLGKAAKTIESVLDIKPLITFHNEDGKAYPCGVARTRRKSIEQMYTRFFASLDHKKNLHICVMHGNALEDALDLMERIRKEYHPAELLLNFTGTALGLNTGPLALGLIGYAED